MADGNITVTREASMEELRKSVAELLGEPADWPDHGNAPLAIAATMALLHEGCKRLEAENAALKREAHEWWTAARDATKAETERCALVAALHSQYPVTTEFDRGYAKARADAAAAIRRGA